MDIRRITIRVSPELHEQAFQAATQEHVSLNQLVTRVLESYVLRKRGETERFPLRELGVLLAPTAQASELSEEELMAHVRDVRKRIWKERYEAAVQAETAAQTAKSETPCANCAFSPIPGLCWRLPCFRWIGREN